jgi:hypothetical protein
MELAMNLLEVARVCWCLRPQAVASDSDVPCGGAKESSKCLRRSLGVGVEHRVRSRARSRYMLRNWFKLAANRFVSEGRVQTLLSQLFSLLE